MGLRGWDQGAPLLIIQDKVQSVKGQSQAKQVYQRQKQQSHRAGSRQLTGGSKIQDGITLAGSNTL